eukprot:COSAG02_NODE_9_length_59728_cov_36.104714_5_plen_43_part_00
MPGARCCCCRLGCQRDHGTKLIGRLVAVATAISAGYHRAEHG